MTAVPPLDYIFHPRSVAIVGASTSSDGDQFVDALKSMPFRGPMLLDPYLGGVILATLVLTGNPRN